ncbi:hypothetical protein BDR07DRAFT_1407005 [Suillus spraguei]|nr:hypothetical protein BDR07DRAFT_1407005 [Suillus spraguei]
MAPVSKRRKLSDLTSGDTNELLNKIEEFRSKGDKYLPDGLIDKLQELRDKLENDKHTSFSKVDPTTLASLKISDKKQEIEDLGLAEIPECLLIDTTRSLISLVRSHVATVTEAGCRILINILLLRVVSVCPDVNIIPEFPILKRHSTRSLANVRLVALSTFCNPSIALGRPGNIKEPIMSNIFEAKLDNIWAVLSQATVAAASYCQLQGLSVIRGVITSGEQWMFFVYKRHTDGTGGVLYSPEYTLGPNLEHLAFVLGLLRDSIDNATSSNLAFFTTP